MQNNIDKNERDPFCEIFRQKLENHSLPVDPESWGKIQAGINTGKRKRIIPFWWLYSGSGAAVAVMMLLFFLQPFNQHNSEIKIAQQQNNSQKEVLKQHATETDNNTSSQNKATFNQQNTVKSTSIAKQTVIKIKSEETETKLSNQSRILTENIETKQTKTEITQETEKKAQKEQLPAEKEISTTNEKQIAMAEIPKNDWTDPIHKEKSSNWGVKALLSSGSGTSSNPSNPVFNDISGKMGIVRAETMNTSILTPSDFSNRTFFAPINFGLKVSKQLDGKFSMETGLTYTYLLTKFKSLSYDAALNLHYVGIPISFAMKVLGNQKWNIYGSTGMMVEKGVRSVYVQKQYYSNQIITTTASTNIDGLQWSMNISGGVSYRIINKFDIYVAPKISYYFDNNQPMSVRTDRKTSVEVEGGLKYNF